MKRLTQLLAAGLFLATSQMAMAQSFSPLQVATEARAAAKAEVLLLDKNPSYKQWQKEYQLDKVEYRTDATVMHFRYIGGSYSYIMLYAPNGDHPWLLRDKATGREFGLKGVYNVRQNGKLVSEHIASDLLSLHSNYEANEKMIVTCEVHFAPLPATVKAVDLIEGAGTETYYNHFHVLNIKVKQPKTPMALVEEVAAVEEPAVAQPKVASNKATQLAEIPGVVCNVYPNPAAEILNVELSDVQEARMQLLSSNGQVIWSGVTQDRTTTVNVGQYPAGNYFMHITIGNQTAVKSVIVE